MTTIAKMNNEKSSTVLMVTHDPFAASFCKRIIFIKDGKIKLIPIYTFLKIEVKNLVCI